MTTLKSRVGDFVQKSKTALFTDAAQLSAAELREKHHSSGGHKHKTKPMHKTKPRSSSSFDNPSFPDKLMFLVDESEMSMRSFHSHDSGRDEALREKSQRSMTKGRNRVSKKHHHDEIAPCHASDSSLTGCAVECKGRFAYLGEWGEDNELFD